MGAKWNTEQKRKWLYANVKLIIDNMVGCDTIMGVDLAAHRCATVVVDMNGEVVESRVFGKSSAYSPWEKVRELGLNFEEMLSQHKPQVVGFESVRSSRNFTGLRALFLSLATLYAALGNTDYDTPTEFDIPVIAPFVPSQIKKFMTDNGRADKEDMIRACRELGFDPADDNEADAYSAAYLTMNLIRYAVWLNDEVIDLDSFDNKKVRDGLKRCPEWLSESQKEMLDAYLMNDTFMKEIAKRRYAKVAKRIREGKDFVNL